MQPECGEFMFAYRLHINREPISMVQDAYTLLLWYDYQRGRAMHFRLLPMVMRSIWKWELFFVRLPAMRAVDEFLTSGR